MTKQTTIVVIGSLRVNVSTILNWQIWSVIELANLVSYRFSILSNHESSIQNCMNAGTISFAFAKLLTFFQQK